MFKPWAEDRASGLKTHIHSSRQHKAGLFCFLSFILMAQLWPHLASKTNFLPSMSSK